MTGEFEGLTISGATVKDGKRIREIINDNADAGKMLPRSLSSIYDFIRDFLVCRELDGGEIVGVCALRVCWEDLAEIRSLVVEEKYRKKGVARKLVSESLNEAKKLGLEKVFVLTYVPEFFEGLGFARLPKSELPHKIWADCIHCAKFPDCDEEALIVEPQK